MHSKNPVFARKTGGFQTAGYAAQAQGMSAEQLREMYTAPSYQGPKAGPRMTIDDVVARTAMTLGTLIIVAGATWYFTNPNGVYLIGAALVGLGVGFFIGLKHITNPVVILAYAAIEGIFVGQASELLDAYASRGLGTSSGIVPQAVLGTLCAAAGMLALYKFRIIRVTGKFKKFVIGATAGFFLLVMVNLLLSLFGLNLGISGLGGIGLIFAIIGVALACFNLMLDFDYVETGIREGAPQKDAWFAAFGLTVTLVWLYIELLRIFAILRGDD